MRESVVHRVLWKEYRTFRSFWICMVVLTLFLQWLVVYVAHSTDASAQERDALPFIALAMTLFYGLGVGATIFSMEHEQTTFEQLRAWPSGFREVWLGKTLFVFLSSIALGLALTLATRSLWGTVSWWMGGLAALLGIVILSLSILCSLLIRRPLLATFTAGGSAFVAWILSDWIWDREPSSSHAGASAMLFSYALIGLAVLLVTYFMAARWFANRRWAFAKGVSRSRAAHPAMSSQLVVPSQIARTAWLTLRQLRWVWLSVLILAASLSLFLLSQSPGQFEGYLTLFGVCPILLGATLFAGDQSQQSYRFFTERGVSARQFWWQRQLVGLMILLTLLFVTLPPVVRYGAFLMAHGENLFVVTGYLAYCVLVYALGQFLSMALRSPLLALTFTFVGALLIAAWCFLVTWFHLPWWLAIVIPAAGMGMASWARVRDWMLERDEVKSWGGPAAALAVALVATVGAFYLHRVYEIPWTETGTLSESLPADRHAGLTEDATSTFLAALQQTDPSHIPSPDRYEGESQSIQAMRLNSIAAPPWSELPGRIPGAESKWLDEHRETLHRVLLPALNDADVLFRGRDRSDRSTDVQWRWPVYLLVAEAREQQAAGDLTMALDSYRSAMLICDKLRSSGDPFDGWIARQAESLILQNLLFWAAADRQTADQLAEAIEWSREWLGKEQEWITSFTPVFQLQREWIAKILQADGPEEFQSGPAKQYLFWVSILPGEGRRWQRLLGVMEHASLDVMQRVIAGVQQQQPVAWLFFDEPERAWEDVWPDEWRQLEEWKSSTPLLRPFLDQSLTVRQLLIGKVLQENLRLRNAHSVAVDRMEAAAWSLPNRCGMGPGEDARQPSLRHSDRSALCLPSGWLESGPRRIC